MTALSSTSSSFGTAAASTKFDNPTNGNIDENLKAQALAEEEAAMNQYKVTIIIFLAHDYRCNVWNFLISVESLFTHSQRW